MRTLLLLRGAPGCGKSTWIEKNGLKKFAISADDIRQMIRSTELGISGNERISFECDHLAWEILFTALENRMTHGDFIVIDATNSKTSEMKQYKNLCTKYRYRIFVVDFTDIPIDVVKERNRNRLPEYKRVSDYAIENMYTRFQTQNVPSGYTVIKPDELDKIMFRPIDFTDKYSRINHIGDIHGCFDVLITHLKCISKNPEAEDPKDLLNDDELYIFCGDYTDRGIQNVQVVKFLISIMNMPNVLLIEGNHEQHLRTYANGETSVSKNFENYTKHELDASDINRKDIKKLTNKFIQCAYYKYGSKTVLVTHGGLSNIPDELLFVPACQMIKGVGEHSDVQECIDSFSNNLPSNFIQVFGHRNDRFDPIESKDHRNYLLEGGVEFGFHLRCMYLTKDNQVGTFIWKNNVFKPMLDTLHTGYIETLPMNEVLEKLYQNKYVKVKEFGLYRSLNFSSKAFSKGVWNDETVKCRGLFVDTEREKVAARSYDKFFNINEREETRILSLRSNLKFPLTCYLKENGFLGILSYDEYDDSLLFCTKSNMIGGFIDVFKAVFEETVSKESIRAITDFVRDNDVSLVFEVEDIVNDPHIIEYKENRVVLLDIIKNKLQTEKFDYDYTRQLASSWNIPVKKKLQN